MTIERPARTSAKWRAYPDDVLPLWVAEMDYPLAAPIAAALHDAIDRSDTGYRWVGDLAEALAEFSGRRLGWAPDPQRVMLLGDVLVPWRKGLPSRPFRRGGRIRGRARADARRLGSGPPSCLSVGLGPFGRPSP